MAQLKLNIQLLYILYIGYKWVRTTDILRLALHVINRCCVCSKWKVLFIIEVPMNLMLHIQHLHWKWENKCVSVLSCYKPDRSHRFAWIKNNKNNDDSEMKNHPTSQRVPTQFTSAGCCVYVLDLVRQFRIIIYKTHPSRIVSIAMHFFYENPVDNNNNNWTLIWDFIFSILKYI